MQIRAVAATLVALLTFPIQVVPATALQESYIPPVMRACSSENAINCIEGITITDSAGNSANGYLSGQLVQPSWLRVGEAFDVWNVELPNIPVMSIYVESRIRPDGQPLCWIESNSCSTRSGAIDMGVTRIGADFDLEYTFAIRLRVKDFSPGGLGGKAKNVSFQNLPSTSGINGARTFVLSGTNLAWDWYEISPSKPTSPGLRERADATATAPVFWLWDSNNDALWRLPGNCRTGDGQTIPHFMFTAYNMGIPQWDPTTLTLSVTLESAHLAADGSKNRGYYEIFLPKVFASCMWGVDTGRAAKASVEVRDSASGEPQVAVVTQESSSAGLRIVASNFHYSMPTISVSLSQQDNPKAKKPLVSPKTKQITCAKNQTRKLVRAYSPKCPSGWKRIG